MVSEPPVPPGGKLPDRVLRELQGAFEESADPAERGDGPPSSGFAGFDGLDSLDRFLGLDANGAGDSAGAGDGAVADADVTGELELPDEPTAQVPVVDEPSLELVARPRRTIVIADEGLPDAVYLDEEKEKGFRDRRSAGPDGRSTIVIEDLDGFADADTGVMKVSGGIDPRMRARRVAARKDENKRKLFIFGLVFAAVAAVVLVVAMLGSRIFDVREVDVQGVVYSDQAAVDAVVTELRGQAVLLVDTRAAEVQLEAIPWVERATVRRDFPHTVYIDIRERRPVASFQGADGMFRVIDASGRVLDVLAGQPVEYLVITGQHAAVPAGEFAGPSYAAAANLVLSLPDELRAITSSVGINPTTGGLSMVVNGTIQVRLGDLRNVDDKLARLLGQVRAGLAGICELDVSTGEVGVVECVP